jgi:hypothetical protein
MRLQRLSVVAPFANADVDPEIFVGTFHEWVRDKTLGGLPIDVARYNHVPEGPGTVLIGFEGDYAVETSTGVPALRYTLKRDNQGSVAELVTLAVGRLQQAAATIAEQTGESVDFGTITLRIADKLVAPNTDAGRQLVQADAVAAVAATLGLTDPQVSIGTLDPRDPITLVVSAPGVVAAAG